MKTFALIATLAVLAGWPAVPAQAQNPMLAATPTVQVLTRGTINAVVRLSDMDHSEAAMRALPGFNRYHPGDLTEAMVALALALDLDLGTR